MRRLSFPTWILFLALATSALAPPTRAQGSGTPTLEAMAKELICSCPSCGGKALDQCEPGCRDGQERRDAVTAQLKEGKSREQVLQFMSATYGAAVLGDPPSEGWGILSSAIPLACMALGALPLLWFTRRKKSPALRSPKKSVARVAPAEDARVEAALKDFDY